MAAVDKSKLINDGKKLLQNAVAATAGLVKAVGDEAAFHKQAKAMRAKIIKLIKKKPYNAKKVKAETAKYNAFVKNGDARAGAAIKAAITKLEASAKAIEAFLKANKAALGKAGAAQLNQLSKTLTSRLRASREYLKLAH